MKSSLSVYLVGVSILCFVNAAKAQGEIGECSNLRDCENEEHCCFIIWEEGGREGNREDQEGIPEDPERFPEGQDRPREGEGEPREGEGGPREVEGGSREGQGGPPQGQGGPRDGQGGKRDGQGGFWKGHKRPRKEMNGTCMSLTGLEGSTCSVPPHHGRHHRPRPGGRQDKKWPGPRPEQDGQSGRPSPPPEQNGQDGSPPRELERQDGRPTRRDGRNSNRTRYQPPRICGCKGEENLFCKDGICQQREGNNNERRYKERQTTSS